VATTIGELLAERAARDPERACVSCDGEVWSYGEMEERAARVTGGLRRLGLAPGARVCLMLPNGLPFLAAWFGIERLGAVAVPINTAYRGELLGYVVNNSGASVVVVGEEYLDRLAFVEDGVPALEHVVVVPSTPPPASRPSLRWDTTEFDALLEGPPGEPGRAAPSAKRPRWPPCRPLHPPEPTAGSASHPRFPAPHISPQGGSSPCNGPGPG